MTSFGFHCSHEQVAPSRLLACARLAEAHGFLRAMCSDHFHPWSETQGESGFAWSWLGAALEATTQTFGVVCAPGQRYHPAIIAQAAATLASMYEGRFWLAVGSGEAVNESVTGQPWPDKRERNARLRECADVMRALWNGETVTHEGLVKVKEAKLYTRPKKPPLLFGAALSVDTAKWFGEWADGLITVAQEPEALSKIVEAFRAGGGRGKPMLLQAALSYARTDEEALEAAYDQWRQAGLASEDLANITTPKAFDDATARIPLSNVKNGVRVSSRLDQHIAWLKQDAAFGFETIYLHNVGRNLEDFVRVFGTDVLPELANV